MALKMDYIVRTECDEPMARNLKYLPCNHQCRTCLACILVDVEGGRQHVADKRIHNQKKVKEN